MAVKIIKPLPIEMQCDRAYSVVCGTIESHRNGAFDGLLKHDTVNAIKHLRALSQIAGTTANELEESLQANISSIGTIAGQEQEGDADA